MARTTREKYFMVAVGAAVGLWALDRYAVTPYVDARKDVIEQQAAAREQLDGRVRLQRERRRMAKTWAAMRDAGIESSPSEAERKMLHAIQAWAQDAGIAHLSLRPERVNKDHGFVQIIIHASGSGPSGAVAKLLWSVESATQPVLRVDGVQMRPTKEGTDDLQLELTASTLCATRAAEEKSTNGGGRQRIAAAAAGRDDRVVEGRP
jgi:hypothetical protein